MAKRTMVPSPTPPREDPVNSLPRTIHGYPVRVASSGETIRYVESEARRNIIIMAEEGLQENAWYAALPWWRKLQEDFKVRWSNRWG